MKLKYCVNCKWSRLETRHMQTLKCTHPIVNANDPYVLSAPVIDGRDCSNERRLKGYFFIACGLRGKLYEAR